MPFGKITVTLTNGKRYKISCLNVKKYGKMVFCDVLDTKNVDTGILFFDNKMYFYDKVCPQEKCIDSQGLFLPTLGKFCIREIFDIEGVISKKYYQKLEG